MHARQESHEETHESGYAANQTWTRWKCRPQIRHLECRRVVRASCVAHILLQMQTHCSTVGGSNNAPFDYHSPARPPLTDVRCSVRSLNETTNKPPSNPSFLRLRKDYCQQQQQHRLSTALRNTKELAQKKSRRCATERAGDRDDSGQMMVLCRGNFITQADDTQKGAKARQRRAERTHSTHRSAPTSFPPLPFPSLPFLLSISFFSGGSSLAFRRAGHARVEERT